MKYKVSIVIPVYNAGDYLEECIESIVNQSIGFENLQVILVNDGSKDNSAEIIDAYCKKYENIKGIHLPESHSLGGFARNQGLTQVEGKYLMFVDSDDFIDQKACEVMYEAITKNAAQVVTANYKCMDQNGRIWDKAMFDQEKYKSCELKEANQTFFYLYCPSVCMKIFDATLIKENNIKFLEGVPAEDAYFSCNALLKSKKVCYVENVIYYYRRRNTGEVSTSWMRNKKYFINVNYAFKEIYQLFKTADKIEYYKFFYAKNLISLIYKFIDSKLISNEERIELMNELYWFFEQSREFNIVLAQRSIEILLEYILDKKNEEAIKACEIIAELRTFMTEVQKEMTSKPQKITI